ncbi:MAG TPA: MFS transporter [Candidatus Margulisiibacteriota bacterium]|nr:MFS transporter [Candidatus Margulisiibacteriota bacterium]
MELIRGARYKQRTMIQPPAQFTRRAVALSAASFAILGGCLTLPGTLLPLLLERFAIRLVEAGSMLALQPVGYLLAVLAAGRLIATYGMRAVLAAGMATSAAGFAGFGLISTWSGGAAMMLVSGLGFGIMEVGTNSLLIVVGGERRANLLNLAHLFFGVGSFVTPVLAAHAVAGGVSWRLTFFAAAAATASVALGWGLFDVHGIVPTQPAAGAAHRALRSRTALLCASMLGVYVGTEVGIGGWLTKYMVTVRGVTLTYAGNALSVYWLGLAAGRIALSVLSHRIREEKLLTGLTLGAAVASCSVLIVESPIGAVIGAGLTGLAFSGIFPAVIALGGRSHPHDTAGVTSVMIAGAGLGGIVIPWTMSAVAEGAGLVAGMALYPVLCAALLGQALLVRATLPASAAVATRTT